VGTETEAGEMSILDDDITSMYPSPLFYKEVGKYKNVTPPTY